MAGAGRRRGCHESPQRTLLPSCPLAAPTRRECGANGAGPGALPPSGIHPWERSLRARSRRAPAHRPLQTRPAAEAAASPRLQLALLVVLRCGAEALHSRAGIGDLTSLSPNFRARRRPPPCRLIGSRWRHGRGPGPRRHGNVQPKGPARGVSGVSVSPALPAARSQARRLLTRRRRQGVGNPGGGPRPEGPAVAASVAHVLFHAIAERAQIGSAWRGAPKRAVGLSQADYGGHAQGTLAPDRDRNGRHFPHLALQIRIAVANNLSQCSNVRRRLCDNDSLASTGVDDALLGGGPATDAAPLEAS